MAETSTSYTNSILIDKTNWQAWKDTILQELRSTNIIGLDLETHDADRHEGFNKFMKIASDGKSKNGKLVFDVNRTTICGFSIHASESPYSYYFNLNHADVENRLDPLVLHEVLGTVTAREDAWFIAHNAPFELVMLKCCYDIDIPRIICTLQMAVSAYNDDEYPLVNLKQSTLNSFKPIFKDIREAYHARNRELAESDGSESRSSELNRLVGNVVAKDSKAAYSYNSFVKNIAYGYGLKQAVKSWFGYSMQSFEETLNGKAHMGELEAWEVVSYGADDAFWAVELYKTLYNYIQTTNPPLLQTFFEQENPMAQVFADSQRAGLKINKEAIFQGRLIERQEYAKILRTLRGHVRSILDGRDWPDNQFNQRSIESLMKREKWYVKNSEKYRKLIRTWANYEDTEDDYEECLRVRGSLPQEWAEEKGNTLGKNNVNITHYMPARVLLYDLCGFVPIVGKGSKISSNADARTALRGRANDAQHPIANHPQIEAIRGLLDALAELSSVDQRVKLYIKPYGMLRDPDTGRVHPSLSSKLSTRRLAAQNPNTMQLSKSGAGAYIRSFYEADRSDHLIVSLDWSQLELVLIGAFSQDPEFINCYSQLPYKDLHSRSASGMLGLTLEEFLSLKKLPSDTQGALGLEFRSQKGEKLPPADYVKEMRRSVGKGSNFEYWYSGSLSNLASQLGWGTDEMWENTDRYRATFPVAEQWRLGVRDEVARQGFITLPDHHRRVRLEATKEWESLFGRHWNRFNDPALTEFSRRVVKRLRNRSLNQAVNAMIQGTNATMTKRSILAINKELKANGIPARFMTPIHDEVLFSVHHDYIYEFLMLAKKHMCNFPWITGNIPLDATAAIGYNYQTFHQEKNQLGQFELDEASEADFLPEELWGSKLNQDGINQVVDYMKFKKKELGIL